MLAALVMALSVNVTNALDVRPGRALKWALLLMVPVIPGAWGQGGWRLSWPRCIGAAVVALPFDLRERAMLGDAGSNPLGLAAGAGLAAVLPDPGLAIAAGCLAVAPGGRRDRHDLPTDRVGAPDPVVRPAGRRSS